MNNYNCPLCEDRGIVIQDLNWASPCSCVRQKSISNKFKNAKMSKDMLNISFAKFNLKYYSKEVFTEDNNYSLYDKAKIALNAAKRFVAEVVENPHRDGLLFTGPVGSGKTFLACCIANALLELGKEVLFIVVPDLLDEIKATYDNYNNREITEQELMSAARNVEVLILDDLGAHNYTEWAKNKLYSIINYRLNNRLPVIITTNISLEELDEYLGDRTTSRINQMCEAYRLYVDKDIRTVSSIIKRKS